MGTVRRSTTSALLLALKTRLADQVEGLDASRIIVTVRDPGDVPHWVAEQSVLLRPQTDRPVGEYTEASGRWDDRRELRLDVVARSRVLLDESDRDLVRLTDDSLGHLAFRDAIRDVLQEWAAELGGSGDGATDWIMHQPLQGRDWSAPAQDRSNPDFTWSALTVLVQYATDLTLTDDEGQVLPRTPLRG